jgi:hydroxyacylglutathione hydrolase
MLQIKVFTFNALQENTYLLYDETGEAVVIDPGCYIPSEENTLAGFIKDNKLILKALLSTHSHVDHVLGNAFVKRTFQVPHYIHPLDAQTLLSVKVYAPMYGFAQYQESEADHFLNDKEVFAFGNTQLEVLFVPGHAPGHIAFYQQEHKLVLSGDVLFQGSIGRTDLPGGDFDTLIHSIKSRLFPLGDDTTVYPGHGPKTTIAREKRHNPFLK